MTATTFKSLSTKAEQLRQAMDIKSVDFGHNDGGLNFFVELHGKRGDGVGTYRAEFATVQALHAYFNDKIRLFSN